ncbi:MAG: hypothetical protein WBV94_24040 [Blastocatellia bacterium]
MMPIPNSDAWLHHVAMRLQSDAFVPLDPQSYQPAGFKFAVRRTRFEIAKFGMAETFFVFADIPALTPQIMTSFSTGAFQFALQSKTVPLPCGLFESVWCFAVAVTSNLHPQMVEIIRNTTPPKHWSAGEIPVIFDAATGYLCFFEKTPVWGAAYYAGFRKQIQQYLG